MGSPVSKESKIRQRCVLQR